MATMLDMSLDDIIKQRAKTKPPARRGGLARRPVARKARQSVKVSNSLATNASDGIDLDTADSQNKGGSRVRGLRRFAGGALRGRTSQRGRIGRRATRLALGGRGALLRGSGRGRGRGGLRGGMLFRGGQRAGQFFRGGRQGGMFLSRRGRGRGRFGANRGRGGLQARASIFSRLGGGPAINQSIAWYTGAAATQGTEVYVSNLNYDIMTEDIKELFGSIGRTLSAEVFYDRSGRSEGEASVVFAKRSDALAAINQLNMRTLDGTPMEVQLAENVEDTTNQGGYSFNNYRGGFNNSRGGFRGRSGRGGRRGGGGANVTQSRSTQGNNVRVGLFGTAMQETVNSNPRGRGRGRRGRGGVSQTSTNTRGGLFGTELGLATNTGASRRRTNAMMDKEEYELEDYSSTQLAGGRRRSVIGGFGGRRGRGGRFF